MKARDILIYLAVKNRGDFTSIMDALKKKEPVDAEEVEKVAAKYPNVITMVDEDYPEQLRQAMQPPVALFLNGKPEDFKSQRFSLIHMGCGGSPSGYEKWSEAYFKGKRMAEGNTVLERQYGKLTFFATCPDGKGYEISPFPNEMWGKPSVETSKQISIFGASLANDVLIIRLHPKDMNASMMCLTALNLNRDIYALPHENDYDRKEDECNFLIENGATPLLPISA